jgi:hypothetical protein
LCDFRQVSTSNARLRLANQSVLLFFLLSPATTKAALNKSLEVGHMFELDYDKLLKLGDGDVSKNSKDSLSHNQSP